MHRLTTFEQTLERNHPSLLKNRLSNLNPDNPLSKFVKETAQKALEPPACFDINVHIAITITSVYHFTIVVLKKSRTFHTYARTQLSKNNIVEGFLGPSNPLVQTAMSQWRMRQDAKGDFVKANKELQRDLQAQAQLQQEQAAHTLRSAQCQVAMSTLAAQADRSRQALTAKVARAAQAKETPASCLYFTFTPHFHQPSHVRHFLQDIASQWYLLAAIEAIPQETLPQDQHVPGNLRYDVDPTDMRTWDASLLASLMRLAMASREVQGRVNAMEMVRQSVLSRRALRQGMSCITFWDIDSARKFFEQKKNMDDEKMTREEEKNKRGEEAEEKKEAQVGDDDDEKSDGNNVQDDTHDKSGARAGETPSPTKSAQGRVTPRQTLKSNSKFSAQSSSNSPPKTSSPNKRTEDEENAAKTYDYIDQRKRDSCDRAITKEQVSKLSLKSPNYPDPNDENYDLYALPLSVATVVEAAMIADEQQNNTDGQDETKIRTSQQEETKAEQARNSTDSKKRKRRAKSWGQLAFKPSPNKKAKTSSQLPTTLKSPVKSSKTPPPTKSDITHPKSSSKKTISPCTLDSSSSSSYDSSPSHGNSSHNQSVTPGTSPACSQVYFGAGNYLYVDARRRAAILRSRIDGTVHNVEERLLMPLERAGATFRAALENARTEREITGDATKLRDEGRGVEEADSPLNQVSMEYMMQGDRQQPASVEDIEQRSQSEDSEMGEDETDASQHASTKKEDIGYSGIGKGENQDASKPRRDDTSPTTDSSSDDDAMSNNTPSESSSDGNRDLDPDYDPDEAQDQGHTEQIHENMPLNPIDQVIWGDMGASQGEILTHLRVREALEADQGKQQDEDFALGDFSTMQVDIRGFGRNAREWRRDVVQPEQSSSSEPSNAGIDSINAEYDTNRNQKPAQAKRPSSIASSNPEIPEINALYDAARGEEPAQDIAQYRRIRHFPGFETSSIAPRTSEDYWTRGHTYSRSSFSSSSSSPAYPSEVVDDLQQMSNSRDVTDLAASPSASSNSDKFSPGEAASTREAFRQHSSHSRTRGRERMGPSLSSSSVETSRSSSASSVVRKARFYKGHRIVKVIRLRPGEACVVKAARKRGDRN